ncbi:MAG: hypothetical protein GY857_17315, partial [Desulfobacula sp.]|nr:hypothetical protein [Desulfobacula sp.]
MKHILLNLLNFFVLIFVVVFWLYPNIVYADSNASAQIIEIKSSSKDFPDKAGLKDEIIIKVINASMLNDEQFTTQKVILFFDGMPLRGAYPRKNSVDRKGNGELKFFIPHD